MITVAEIESFLDRVRATIASAEADRRTVQALRALVAGSSRLGALPRGSATSRSEGAGRGRPANVANDGRILELVRSAKDGIRVGELSKTLRMNRKALARTLKRLREGGQVRMTGEKRLARYHAA